MSAAVREAKSRAWMGEHLVEEIHVAVAVVEDRKVEDRRATVFHQPLVGEGPLTDAAPFGAECQRLISVWLVVR